MAVAHILNPLPTSQPGGQIWPLIDINVKSLSFPPVPGTSGTGVTPITTNFTQELVLVATGPWTAPQNVFVRFNKIDRVITMNVSEFVPVDAVTANVPVTITGIPTWAQSAGNIYCFVRVKDNGAVTTTPGSCLIQSLSNVMQVFMDTATAGFTINAGASTAGVFGFTVTYIQL